RPKDRKARNPKVRIEIVLGVSASRGTADSKGKEPRLAPDSDRSLHPCEAGGKGHPTVAPHRKTRVDPPGQLRFERSSTHARRSRCVCRGRIAGSIREGGGPIALLPALRRTLGSLLAGR